jgi:hypothetical protein
MFTPSANTSVSMASVPHAMRPARAASKLRQHSTHAQVPSAADHVCEPASICHAAQVVPGDMAIQISAIGATHG